jgi:hypothetical protein
VGDRWPGIEEALEHRGRLVAQRRARTAGEDRREPPLVAAEGWGMRGVDAVMDAMKAAAAGRVVNRIAADPGVAKLRRGDQPELPAGERRDRSIPGAGRRFVP